MGERVIDRFNEEILREWFLKDCRVRNIFRCLPGLLFAGAGRENYRDGRALMQQIAYEFGAR